MGLSPDSVFDFIILIVGAGLMYASCLLYVGFVRSDVVRDYLDVFFRVVLAVVAASGFYLVLNMTAKFLEGRL